jgi:hypothetical protein
MNSSAYGYAGQSTTIYTTVEIAAERGNDHLPEDLRQDMQHSGLGERDEWGGV